MVRGRTLGRGMPDLRLLMVRLCYSFCGKRYEAIVSIAEAIKLNRRLLAVGAAVYWTERL
jgi:hypothetical protein